MTEKGKISVIANDNIHNHINQCIKKKCENLHESKHIRTMKIVKETVGVNEKSCGTPTGERSPPPPMIFHGQLKICKRNANKRRDLHHTI
jgi:hypothetical protein